MKTKVNLSHTIRVVTAVSLLMSQGLDDVVGVAVHAKMQSTENLIEANTLDSADGLQTNDSNTEAELVLEQQLESNDNMMSDVQVMLSESVEQTKLDSSLS